MATKTYLYVNGDNYSSKNFDIEHQYQNFSISLPPGHMLPIYQRDHIKYDRFLPHLCRYIESNKTVLDIGANVGDTLAAMIEKNPALEYVCVEPDDEFFSYLEKNIKKIEKSIPSASIKSVKALIGKYIENATLEGSSGTKHAITAQQFIGQKSVELDDLISDLTISNISLLKSDVDGYDWDVINSAELLLRKQHPLIFFECQYESELQKENYIKTINFLGSIGYCDWTIFDNFGSVIIRTGDIECIFQMMNYIWAQNCKQATRTIFYYDILAATNAELSIVDKALNDY